MVCQAVFSNCNQKCTSCIDIYHHITSDNRHQGDVLGSHCPVRSCFLGESSQTSRHGRPTGSVQWFLINSLIKLTFFSQWLLISHLLWYLKHKRQLVQCDNYSAVENVWTHLENVIILLDELHNVKWQPSSWLHIKAPCIVLGNLLERSLRHAQVINQRATPTYHLPLEIAHCVSSHIFLLSRSIHVFDIWQLKWQHLSAPWAPTVKHLGNTLWSWSNATTKECQS